MASAAATADGDAPVTPDATSGLPPWPQLIGFLLMAFGMFMAILDIQIVSASLTQIQAGLAASADEISWVQTSYLVSEVVMIPLSGFLARALSTKWLFVLSSAGFTIASILCSTATSINEMIVYRSLQGFVGGAMIPTMYSAMFLMFGRGRQSGVSVAVSLIVTMAPTIGPALGGWISEVATWHWLFLVNIIPGVIITFGVWALVDVDRPNLPLLRRIDLIGLVAMAFFLGGLDYVLEEGARRDWFADGTVFTVFVIATVAAVIFFWRSLTVVEPVVNLKVFANTNFLFGGMLGAIVGIGLYGLVYLYPVFLARIALLSSGQIGATLWVTGLSMLFVAPLMGMLARRSDPRRVLLFGFLMLALSTWLTRGITDEWRFAQLFLPQVVRGVGLIACLTSISVTSFATLPMEYIKDAGGLFTLMRNIGGAIGLAMINTIILWRTNLHWGRLAESVNPGRPEVQAQVDALTALATEKGLADPEAAAMREIGHQVMEQAMVMAYADCFTVLSWLFVVFAIVPMFLKRPPTLASVAAAESH
ncbi:DHA2 family efflux MFS transporter permease subunit [Polymorphobacter arshaanensis]|uniref:DHA2 family efflux MFS transporter permease subunit n=1 Tax=Glacieibacterium arshaanense TaxID=2511025 RepID=A0A4Y9ENU1_9SPHN|nr:DHA2 family efflux MFS transporter permease subunit [Polymorphobacter arshaanensis]TFU03390.1 DHA2 family efflux MFS transporter permease subunit [Polymorphobacter arshaanensis]